MPQPAATPFAPGMLPFVRSKPKAVMPFPVVLNRTVQAYVDSYVAQPQGLKQSFQRSQPYLSEMVNVLQSEGLPPDLVYLAFAESAFDETGAGPWQLNKVTARRFGLTIDRWVDQRRDPIESTRAAAEYLATLHDETDHDWRMTLVAWNNGDARLDHYLRLQDATYERLMSRLPRRTRSLMNRFMAVAVIAHHTEEYGIEPAASQSLAQGLGIIAIRHQVFDPPAEIVFRLAVQHRHFMAVLYELLHQETANEEGPADNQNFHRMSKAIRRGGAGIGLVRSGSFKRYRDQS